MVESTKEAKLRRDIMINYYSTVGMVNNKSASFLIFAESLAVARKTIERATHLVASGRTQNIHSIDFDIADLSRVTKSICWGSVRKWISLIKKYPSRYRLTKGIGLHFDYIGG